MKYYLLSWVSSRPLLFKRWVALSPCHIPLVFLVSLGKLTSAYRPVSLINFRKI